MAGAATGYIADANLPVGCRYPAGTNFVFRDQISAERILIAETLAVERNGIPTARRLIPHVENLVARTQILAGIAMAVQTPLHLQ